VKWTGKMKVLVLIRSQVDLRDDKEKLGEDKERTEY